MTTVRKFSVAVLLHNFVLLKNFADDKVFAMAFVKYKNDQYIDSSKKKEIITNTVMTSAG